MTEPKQPLIKQKEAKSIARQGEYFSYIEKYPLFSTLLVLEEYENKEMYLECALIRDAILDYKSKYESHLPKDLKFPTHISTYRGKEHQEMLTRFGINVEESFAIEKAKLIKINLPVK